MLVARYPSSWGTSERYPNGLTAQRFGRMLVKNYGVFSDRSPSKVRGYYAKSFDRALRSVRIRPLSEPAEPDDPDANSGFSPPTGPDRCDECGFHVPIQGHRDGCEQTEVRS